VLLRGTQRKIRGWGCSHQPKKKRHERILGREAWGDRITAIESLREIFQSRPISAFSGAFFIADF
jgi:hypothetical protein